MPEPDPVASALDLSRQSHVLAARFVVPQLPAFLAAYPNLNVELLAAEGPSALIQNGADLAIYPGDLFDSGLVVNKIADTRVVTVATLEYLDQKGDVRSVEDLNNQRKLRCST